MKPKQVMMRAEITMAVYYAVTSGIPRTQPLDFDNIHYAAYQLWWNMLEYARRSCLPLKFCTIDIKLEIYVNKNIT